MAENTSLKAGPDCNNSPAPLAKRRSGSFRLSPARDGNGTGGSTSSSPRLSRGRQKRDSATLEDDSAGTPSDGEKVDSSLKKKAKDKDKKGFSFGASIMNIFSAPHHHKNSELHKIFTSLPASEKLVDDYSCALQRDILIHGRLYVTQSWLCFYANIFSWETLITIPFKSVRAITKEKTVLVIPNAIQVSVSSDKYGFTSLVNRDVTYTIIFKCWQNNLLDQALSPLELVKAAHKARGESTEVGTELDLWGNEAEKEDRKPLTKQVSLPTYVEIGRIPPNSSCTDSDLLGQSLPVGVVNGFEENAAAEGEEEPQCTHSVPDSLHLVTSNHKGQDAASAVSPCSSDGRTVVSGDCLDKGSGGGDSGTEYETVSLIEETGEIPCGCSEHIGRTMLNDVYNADVETIFRLLFTDSDFFRNFNKAEKTINVETGDWQVQSDSSRLRDLSYTVALNYSFGPKFTHTTEHQVYSKTGQPGLKHIVDTEVVNHNIPYGDTFYTVCRYCVTRVAHKKTRLRVTANIKFKKSCWGLVKNLIERNAGDGLRTHYTHLDTVLKEHVESLKDKQSRAHRRASRPSLTSTRRHKRHPASKPVSYIAVTPTLEMEPTGRSRDVSSIGVKTATESRPSSSTAVLNQSDDEQLRGQKAKSDNSLPRVNLALTVLLGVLIVSNMLLYQHLMSYAKDSDVTTPNAPPLTDNLHTYTKDDFGDEQPLNKEEWQALLHQQFSKETGQLREALFNFIHTLDSIENSINSAKKELMSALNGPKVVEPPDIPAAATLNNWNSAGRWLTPDTPTVDPKVGGPATPPANPEAPPGPSPSHGGHNSQEL